jgi:hypothetical protein
MQRNCIYIYIHTYIFRSTSTNIFDSKSHSVSEGKSASDMLQSFLSSVSMSHSSPPVTQFIESLPPPPPPLLPFEDDDAPPPPPLIENQDNSISNESLDFVQSSASSQLSASTFSDSKITTEEFKITRVDSEIKDDDDSSDEENEEQRHRNIEKKFSLSALHFPELPMANSLENQTLSSAEVHTLFIYSIVTYLICQACMFVEVKWCCFAILRMVSLF